MRKPPPAFAALGTLFFLPLFIGALSGCSGSEEANQAANVPQPTAPSQIPSTSPPTVTASPPVSTTEALLAAAENGDTATVKLLVEAGVDANTSDSVGVTGLMVAAREGHVEIVTLLLNAGAQIDATDKDGSTPLILATQAGQVAVAQELVKAGADTSASNKAGETALAIAQREGHKEIAKLFAPGFTPENAQVAELQRLLTELGHDPGPIDGLFGPRTAAAIRAYQEEAGLTVSGTITDALIAHARNALKESRLAQSQTGQGG
ncbi:MAG: ankyrin repeat domain-containing protein [Acidiferrobacterales bacterium]